MKRMLLLALIACLLLTGCALHYDKLTTLRMKGETIKVPIGSVAPVEGKNVQATLTREVHLRADKKVDKATLSDVKIEEENAEKGSADVKK